MLRGSSTSMPARSAPRWSGRISAGVVVGDGSGRGWRRDDGHAVSPEAARRSSGSVNAVCSAPTPLASPRRTRRHRSRTEGVTGHPVYRPDGTRQRPRLRRPPQTCFSGSAVAASPGAVGAPPKRVTASPSSRHPAQATTRRLPARRQRRAAAAMRSSAAGGPCGRVWVPAGR